MNGDLAARVRELEQRNQDLVAQLETVTKRLSTYERFGTVIQEQVNNAMRTAADVVMKAEAEAGAVLRSAVAEREKILTEMHQAAQDIRARAEEDGRRLRYEAFMAREQIKAEVEEMVARKEAMIEELSRLIEAIQSHLLGLQALVQPPAAPAQAASAPASSRPAASGEGHDVGQRVAAVVAALGAPPAEPPPAASEPPDAPASAPPPEGIPTAPAAAPEDASWPATAGWASAATLASAAATPSAIGSSPTTAVAAVPAEVAIAPVEAPAEVEPEAATTEASADTLPASPALEEMTPDAQRSAQIVFTLFPLPSAAAAEKVVAALREIPAVTRAELSLFESEAAVIDVNHSESSDPAIFLRDDLPFHFSLYEEEPGHFKAEMLDWEGLSGSGQEAKPVTQDAGEASGGVWASVARRLRFWR